MRILRARALGMCFGVRDALAVARGIEHPEEVAIWGELVHNEEVNADLAARGFLQVSETHRSGLPGRPVVMITAHGVSDRERRRLADAGKKVIDTTCPLVGYVHRTAQAMARDGRRVIVIGKAGHVEVEGIAGDLEEVVVVGCVEAVQAYDAERLGIVCQTTTPPRLADAVVSEIRRKNPGRDIEYTPTMCQPTRERQLAVEELLPWVQAMVVVGGRNSNNTRQLVGLAEAAGRPCLHVTSADELDVSWLARFHTVGLSAGTSTPDAAIEAVHARLVEIGQMMSHKKAVSF